MRQIYDGLYGQQITPQAAKSDQSIELQHPSLISVSYFNGKGYHAGKTYIVSMMMFRRFKIQLFLILVMILTILPALNLRAQSRGEGMTIIRDTEIENMMKEWSAPVLKAAGMGPESVNVVLVQSNDINAFVAGGANIFFYTGLLEKTDGPGEVMGVFAHELGHITGSHLILGRDAMERASFESILGTVLGIGAAILSGDGQAASAVMAGTNSMAMRRYLSHTRIQESSADQAALSFFEGAQYNPDGLGSFLEKLENEELLPASQQSEYMRTHPITRDRINAVESRASKSPYQDAAFPEHWTKQHARMKAKLVGFISPGRVPWVYDDRDTSIEALYARAIASYRQDHVEQAIQEVNDLITEEPDNPYFYELKGQMLVDFGQIEDGIPAYRKAIELLPNAALFRVALAHALIESGDDKARLQQAVNQLERAMQTERRSTRLHRLLATAYGRLGQENIAKLHLAEEAVLQRNLPYARSMANSVIANSPPGSREQLQARDLLSYIDTLKPIDN